MDKLIHLLNKHTPEQFIENLTNQPITESEKDVIQGFRQLNLGDPVINTLLHYMFFIDKHASWGKLSKMADFFAGEEINSAEEAMASIQQLQQYERQLADKDLL